MYTLYVYTASAVFQLSESGPGGMYVYPDSFSEYNDFKGQSLTPS